MAKMNTGAHASTGASRPTPMRLAPQPHWNTATTTPYAAPIDSRFMITAFSGTSRLRNTTISSRNERMQHRAHEDRQARRGVGGEVVGRGGEPADLHVDLGRSVTDGIDVVAQAVRRGRRWPRPAGRWWGTPASPRPSPSSLACGGVANATPLVVVELVAELVQRGEVGCAVRASRRRAAAGR